MRLSEYPFDHVRLACEKCDRTGGYRKRRLVKRYGADIQLPDLRLKIATDCSRNNSIRSVAMDARGVNYSTTAAGSSSPAPARPV